VINGKGGGGRTKLKKPPPPDHVKEVLLGWQRQKTNESKYQRKGKVMATVLTKTLTRVLNKTVKDGSVVSKLEVTLDPHGVIQLRPQGARKGGPSVVYIDLVAQYPRLLVRKLL